MIGEALGAMVEYFGDDTARIAHTMQVYGYARLIGLRERLDAERMAILECAAALHDVGVGESQRIFGSIRGEYRERSSAIVAKELLESLLIPKEKVEQILFLIRRHRSYTLDAGVAHRILTEAVLLGGAEDGFPYEYGDLLQARDTMLRTKSGLELFNAIYNIQPDIPLRAI